MPKYLHPDRPSDVSDIEQRMRELWQCQFNGRWDMIRLGNWLNNNIDPIFDSLERLEGFLDKQFPDVEVAPVKQIVERKESA